MFAFLVLDLVFQYTKPRDWLEKNVYKMTYVVSGGT